MTRNAFLLPMALAAGILHAQAWQPAPGHTQLPLWPGPIPDARPSTGPETVKTTAGTGSLVAGKP